MNYAKTVATLLPVCLASLGGCADPCFDDGLLQQEGDAAKCAAIASGAGTDGDSDATESGGACQNGVQDGDETDVDCGGSCPAGCDMGESCIEDGDCDANDCDAATNTCGSGNSGDGTAGDGTCDDGTQNQNETDLDCGGTCGASCEVGENCSGPGDCISDLCGDDGTCQPATMWCQDTDGDGFGDPDACTTVPDGDTPPANTVNNDEDCDDASDVTFPGAAPNDSETECLEDKDDDDWGDSTPSGPGTTAGTDCDDDSRSAGTTFPGAAPNDDPTACMNDDDDDDWGDTNVPDGVDAGADCQDNDQTIPPSCMSVAVTANPANILTGGNSALLATPMLGDGSYTFDWTNAASLDDGSIAGPQSTPAISTTYNVEVTDGQGEQATGLVTVHVTDIAVPLTQCQSIDAETLGVDLENHPTPLWAYSNGDTQACETANGDPTALICDIVLDDASFTSRFEVQGNDDDDQLGFVWGYQDASHFYAFTWRSQDQTWSNCSDTFAPEGMVVRRIDADSPLGCEDMLGVADTPNATTLLGPDGLYDQGWNYNEEYVFELSHTPQDFTVTVRRAADDSVVVQETIVDDTYPSGRFGPYTFSQAGSCFWDVMTSAN